MLPSPSVQSIFIQMKWPEWGLTKQRESQSLHQSAKLKSMSQFILAEVLALNLHKRIHLHICYHKTQWSCEISISRLARSGEIGHGWKHPQSQCQQRKDPLWCCGCALSHERQHVVPWEVLIWRAVSLFSSARAMTPCVQRSMQTSAGYWLSHPLSMSAVHLKVSMDSLDLISPGDLC